MVGKLNFRLYSKGQFEPIVKYDSLEIMTSEMIARKDPSVIRATGVANVAHSR